jgi:hypothetical protein
MMRQRGKQVEFPDRPLQKMKEKKEKKKKANPQQGRRNEQ